MRCFVFSVDRKDAEGWETVQRGRPVRSRSTALPAKAPVAVESPKSKGDSDKENVISPPTEKCGSSLTDSSASKSTELIQKDPLHQSEGPLTERTQVSTILNHLLSSNIATFSLEHFLEIMFRAFIH